VLSDTHIRRTGARRLPNAAYVELKRADVILHAGDVLVPELLEELATFAPVHAVLGNNDVPELARVLPETQLLTIGGVRVGMIHDSGARAGRPARMRRRFPDADVVVFGHSHMPQCDAGVDGQLLVNPGSAIERRRSPTHTIAVLDLHDGRVAHAAIVDV
jgi:putative phosphoesterase